MMLWIRPGPRVQLSTLTRALQGALRVAAAMPIRLGAGFALFVALLLFASSAPADEIEPEPETPPAPQSEPEPEAKPEPKAEPAPKPEVLSEEKGLREPNWIPSIDLGFDTFDYNVDTTVQNFINPPSYAGVESEAERQLMFRIGGELMGPMFEDLPGKPRLFAQGGVEIRTTSSDQIYIIGNPDVVLEPERELLRYNTLGDLGKDLPGDFTGQGSEVTGQIQDPSWYAGLGVAFSVPMPRDLLLYIKPSVQYSAEKIDFNASMTTVDEPNPMVDPIPCGTAANRPPCVREFFIYRGHASASKTDHSVGAGLEVALTLFKSLRPVRLSLYANARFMWLVSDDTTEFADSNGVASYSVVRDDFNITGGGGLRFSWVGFD